MRFIRLILFSFTLLIAVCLIIAKNGHAQNISHKVVKKKKQASTKSVVKTDTVVSVPSKADKKKVLVNKMLKEKSYHLHNAPK